MHEFKSNLPPPVVDVAQTQTLVPLKDMAAPYVEVLLASARTEYVFAGQPVFTRGQVDNRHLYLLYGEVSLEDAEGEQEAIKGSKSLLPLAHYQPRQHTARALTDCAILSLDSSQLDKLLTWSQVTDYLHSVIARERDMDEDVEWMMTVLHSNLFFKVPPLNVEKIFAHMQTQTVNAGDVILRQGELGDRCYFIKEGWAEVTRQSHQGQELLATIGPGRCFGEDALVNEAPRNATVTMTENGVLMVLPKQGFYQLLKAPPIATISLKNLFFPPEEEVLIDVRSDEEYAAGHLPGAANIPLHLLGIKSRLLGLTISYILYCNTGLRSSAATHLLTEQGFKVRCLGGTRELFSGVNSPVALQKHSNYVLRSGVAVLGQ